MSTKLSRLNDRQVVCRTDGRESSENAMFDQFHNLMIYFHFDRPESFMNFSGNLYLFDGKLGIDLDVKWNLCYSERTK